MDQFVPADWRSGNMGDPCATPRGQANGFVELLGHSQEHEVAPWFQYQAVDDNAGSLEEDLFSVIFGEMRAASDTAGDYAPPPPRTPGGEKRKQRDTDESPSKAIQDADEPDTVAVTTSTPAQRTTTGKRRRAAQVHNLSERRRRDRINEKMRALQQLVPNCSNKTDRASMLDETIQYLKSLQLQLQVQMMWTTGGVTAPAPASGAHRYMHRVASMSPRMPQLRTCVQNDARL